MPITKSAEKALRQNIKRRKINLKLKNAMKDAAGEFNELINKTKEEGEKTSSNAIKDMQDKLRLAYKAIDKAAKKKVIKKNAASRKKSRLAKKINAIAKKF